MSRVAVSFQLASGAPRLRCGEKAPLYMQLRPITIVDAALHGCLRDLLISVGDQSRHYTLTRVRPCCSLSAFLACRARTRVQRTAARSAVQVRALFSKGEPQAAPKKEKTWPDDVAPQGVRGPRQDLDRSAWLLWAHETHGIRGATRFLPGSTCKIVGNSRELFWQHRCPCRRSSPRRRPRCSVRARLSAAPGARRRCLLSSRHWPESP